MNLTTQRLPSASWLNSARWLVKDGATIVGMIERFGPHKDEEHPWKMYLGIGESIRYLGATYQGMTAALDLLGQNLERIAEDDRDCRRAIMATGRGIARDNDPHRGTVPMPEDWGA